MRVQVGLIVALVLCGTGTAYAFILDIPNFGQDIARSVEKAVQDVAKTLPPSQEEQMRKVWSRLKTATEEELDLLAISLDLCKSPLVECGGVLKHDQVKAAITYVSDKRKTAETRGEANRTLAVAVGSALVSVGSFAVSFAGFRRKNGAQSEPTVPPAPTQNASTGPGGAPPAGQTVSSTSDVPQAPAAVKS